MTVKLGMFTIPFHHPARSPRRVLDQPVALRDEIGHSGTLLMSGPGLGPAQAVAALDGAARDGRDADILAARRGNPCEVRC